MFILNVVILHAAIDAKQLSQYALSFPVHTKHGNFALSLRSQQIEHSVIVETVVAVVEVVVAMSPGASSRASRASSKRVLWNTHAMSADRPTGLLVLVLVLVLPLEVSVPERAESHTPTPARM